MVRGRQAWIWDPNTGEKYKIQLKANRFTLDLGPAETYLIVFDRESRGKTWNPLPRKGKQQKEVLNWTVELKHCREKWSKSMQMPVLKDLKDTEYVHFTGEAVYRTTLSVDDPKDMVLNLGKVWGVNELYVNGQQCGVKWFGERIYDLSGYLHKGENMLEIRVATTMGNYMKTLKDNPTAQKYTVLKTKNQPIQSMGLIGPVTLYKR